MVAPEFKKENFFSWFQTDVSPVLPHLKSGKIKCVTRGGLHRRDLAPDQYTLFTFELRRCIATWRAVDHAAPDLTGLRIELKLLRQRNLPNLVIKLHRNITQDHRAFPVRLNLQKSKLISASSNTASCLRFQLSQTSTAVDENVILRGGL